MMYDTWFYGKTRRWLFSEYFCVKLPAVCRDGDDVDYDDGDGDDDDGRFYLF